MKTIDKIAESLADIINKYYKVLLEENNIDIAFAPEIQISTSELLSLEMRQSLVTFLYSTLGASFDTCYNILGVSSANTEAIKRREEKENGIEEALTPHENFFNQTKEGTTNKTEGTNQGDGRPKAKVETKKQKYDSVRNESKVE